MGRNRQEYSYMPETSGPSWIAIIIMMCVFWPIGVYLLYKRLKVDRKAAMRSGKALNIWGIILIVIGGCAFLGGIADVDSETVVGAVFFLILGIVLKRMATKNKKQAMRVRQYIALIINQHITSLDELSRATGCTYNVVCDDLNMMIEKGYLPGAYLNLSLRRIMLPGQQVPVYRQNNMGQRAQARTKVIKCKGCGAEMIVAEGTIRKCEYCGTPLQG